MATITITPGNSFTATETVTSTKLNDLGSPTAALTAASIGTADIADDAITPALIADDAITTPAILDANVTFAKLTDVIDDDTMATATDTTLATSESIKSYVDAGDADPARGYNNLSHGTASDTIIENTTGRPLFVSFTLFSNNDINVLLLEISPNSDMTGSTRIAQTRIVSDSAADSGGQVCGIVPDGWYWKVLYSGGGSTLSEKVHCSFVL